MHFTPPMAARRSLQTLCSSAACWRYELKNVPSADINEHNTKVPTHAIRTSSLVDARQRPPLVGWICSTGKRTCRLQIGSIRCHECSCLTEKKETLLNLPGMHLFLSTGCALFFHKRHGRSKDFAWKYFLHFVYTWQGLHAVAFLGAKWTV